MFTTVARQNSVPQQLRTSFGSSVRVTSGQGAARTTFQTKAKPAGSFLLSLLRALGTLNV